MVSKSYVKTLGLNLSQVTQEDLRKLAFLVEDKLSKSLNSISGRVDEYEVMVSLSLDSGQINVIIELEYRWLKTPNPELEVLLDQIIDNVLESFEDELLRRYGETNRANT
ncbi:MAG: hypothetical protein QN229_07340 [Desulfurococcaceae archaeon TW002]